MSDDPFPTEQVKDGEPWTWDAGSHYEQCCDCGLVHRVRYIPVDARGKPIKGARIRIAVWRVERRTKAARKKMQKPALVISK